MIRQYQESHSSYSSYVVEQHRPVQVIVQQPQPVYYEGPKKVINIVIN